MTGLCGWRGPIGNDRAPEAVLAAMAAGLVRCGAGSADGHAGRAEKTAALHVEGRTGAWAADLDEDLWVALEGSPRWASQDLAGIAAGQGHAAALKEAYRRHGENLLPKILGSFALCVMDRKAGRTLLAVDRFGVRPLCYAETAAGGLMFATTTGGVAAHGGAADAVSEQSVFEFLFFGVVPSPRTIFAAQRKLLPAQYLVHDGNGARVGFYWEVPYRDSGVRSAPELREEVLPLLRRAVRRATDGVDPATVGAFLSGGLDSSTVVGLAGEVGERPTRTFTIGFGNDRYDEMAYARIVANRFSTDHHEYRLEPADVVEALPRIAAAYDEPFGNSSAVPTYFCARLARDSGVGLMLAGDAGDEIFAGNARYVEQKIYELYSCIPAAVRRFLIEPVVFRTPGTGGWPPFRKARNYVTRATRPMPERMEAQNPFDGVELATIFSEDMLAAIDPAAPLAGLREAYHRPAAASMVQRMLHMDMKITLADNDLRKVGRMCEMADLPVRFPFLDEEVVEFSASVPAELLIRGLRIRDFYKRAVADFLPPEVIAKKKHGFGMPFREWPRRDPGVRELFHDSLAALKTRGYVRPAFIDSIWGADGPADEARFGGMVWDLVMLEQWFGAHA